MQIIISFITGLVFGLGLIVSGMANPSKVIGFLDLAGNWDPSLAFVMGGAILVASISFRLAKNRSKTWLGDKIRLPMATQIDKRLVLGGLTFGVGWGLAGYCPGPALVSLTQGSKPLIFVLAMLAGMAIFELQGRITSSRLRRRS
ncbi:YeeE/YedE family protein [Eoetvoesiella caeni]|uniref:Sulphur transport domain-containing protein n=1 Tax=Eoetvoesiella caeni TaxID=645616 RepID=A0A366H105_9BURK|nr:YeeE/YedE family protein [Eoetvoesiella caeni]MCI2810959.1 YeeE/YedE family protein [Eoetvoesiella caeni]NYT56858.1 YeeE/YedE family protein [Eoetvoesiella caeni]RBP35423.1 hypothetical protein DFR37_11727 [Eoetvoesiella caeni]